jgi:hypothetical protein
MIPDEDDDHYFDTETRCYSLMDCESSVEIVSKIKNSIVYGSNQFKDQIIDIGKTEANLQKLGLFEIDIEDTIILSTDSID